MWSVWGSGEGKDGHVSLFSYPKKFYRGIKRLLSISASCRKFVFSRHASVKNAGVEDIAAPDVLRVFSRD